LGNGRPNWAISRIGEREVPDPKSVEIGVADDTTLYLIYGRHGIG